ncbi:MAG: flippase [Candidatus Brennerbacteria bacterium]|nr:flippase [Candidatus Brennerbacteria bacterium]
MVQKLRELLFQNRSVRQTVVKNTIWLSVSQMGGRLIRASIIIYAARVLGASEYGVFSYVLGLAGFFTIFADVGITSILTREIAKRPEEGTRYFATIFWMKIVLLILTALAVIFLAPHFSKIDAAVPLIPFVAILAIADGLREFSNAFFRAKEKMELEALVTAVTNVAITAAGFVILSYYTTAGALTASYVVSAAVGALAGMFILRREFASIVRSFSPELVRPVLRAAVPIALIALFGALSLNVDLIMLGWWRTASEVGFYSAAQKIVQVLYTVPAIIASSIFPALSRLIGQREEEKEKILVERSLGILFLLAMPIVVGGVVLASPIIALLYGDGYTPSTIVFQALLVTTLFIFPGTFFGNLVFAHNEHKKLAPAVLGVSLINVALNTLLIPLYGIVGAAVATIVTQFSYNTFMWWRSRRILEFKVIAHLSRITMAALMMGVATFGLNLLGIPVLFTIAAGALIYFIALHLFQETLLEELLSIVRKREASAI